MNILICDDDKSFCETLKLYVIEYFKKYHIKDINIEVFYCGEDAVKYEGVFDIAFLDVEMKGLSGIRTGHELKKKNSNLIFFIITSYQQYLDEALHFHAFRYLSKPLDKCRLYMNLKDALYLHSTLNKTVLVETKEATHVIPTSNIIMLETEKRKVVLYTTHGNFTSTRTLSYWIDTLKDLPFFNTHKSYIVNFAHVIRFDSNLVYLDNNMTAYLTQRKYSDFKKNFMMYVDVTI